MAGSWHILQREDPWVSHYMFTVIQAKLWGYFLFLRNNGVNLKICFPNYIRNRLNGILIPQNMDKDQNQGSTCQRTKVMDKNVIYRKQQETIYKASLYRVTDKLNDIVCPDLTYPTQKGSGATLLVIKKTTVACHHWRRQRSYPKCQYR